MSDASPVPDLSPAPQAPFAPEGRSPANPTRPAIEADVAAVLEPAPQAPGPGVDPAVP